MPIKIQSDLPAKNILENENIFVMDEYRALHQDVRPLQIIILNLMPVKEDTELQLLRAMSNTPLHREQVLHKGSQEFLPIHGHYDRRGNENNKLRLQLRLLPQAREPNLWNKDQSRLKGLWKT